VLAIISSCSVTPKISEILGMSENHTAVIIGVGNLGHALIKNFHFLNYGFDLVAAFDVDKALVNTQIAGVKVFHVDALEFFLSQNNIDVAVLTLPGQFAADISARAVEAGVKSIWNFTNEEITNLPKNIIIENVHFSDSLLVLSYYLSQQKQLSQEDDL